MNIYEQGHATLSAFPVLSEVIHSLRQNLLISTVFSIKFGINMSKRRCITPQQVPDEIFADENSDSGQDREDLNLQSNETALQLNKEDGDEADDETVKGL